MADLDKFTTKFNSKVASIQKDVLAISKLVLANSTNLSDDHLKELTILEGLLSSLQEFAMALMTAKEESAVTPAPDANDKPDVPTDPAATAVMQDPMAEGS